MRAHRTSHIAHPQAQTHRTGTGTGTSHRHRHQTTFKLDGDNGRAVLRIPPKRGFNVIALTPLCVFLTPSEAVSIFGDALIINVNSDWMSFIPPMLGN